MNLGKITQSEEEKDIPRRRGLVPEYSGGMAKFESDIMRLVLLVLMVFAGLIGVCYNGHINKPESVIKRSVNKSRSYIFKSSLEGGMSLGGSKLATYRIWYEFHPKHGIRTVSDESTGAIPHDCVEALALLNEIRDPVEYDLEDMFGHGTRHFTGSFNRYTESDTTAYALEYWLDMRSKLPVRLDVAKVDRNAAVNGDGEAMSRETYLTIRYHNWQK